MRRLLCTMTAALLFAALAPACKQEAALKKEKLRVSMIPTTDPSKLIRENQPLADYIGNATGREVELTVPTNYAAVVEALVGGSVDIAYLGGFTYVQASARTSAVPLVQREKDRNFHSVFITAADSPIQSLGDLVGHSFAFGDVNSTSGHLMPEYFMREARVAPEVIEKALYTGGHDSTALAVANKKVDAGALDEQVFARMTKDKKIDPASVRVFYTTPPFLDYIWAGRKGLDPKVAQSFSDALMKLNASDSKDKALLDLLGADKYVKAEDAGYDKLRQAARQAGLLKATAEAEPAKKTNP